MSTSNGSLKHRVKALAERTLGVSISRTPPSKHADHAIRQLRQWSGRDVVFDVGANDGRTILRLNDQLARPQILAFEPVSSTFQTLVERTSRLPNVRAFPLALGEARGRRRIYLNDIDAMNSFWPQWTATPTGEELVEVSTVDEIMERERIDFVHFLKIDTEGYELEVLEGARKALTASRIAIVQLEVGVDQIAKPMLSLEDARRYMAERRYWLYGVYNQCMTRAQRPADWTVRETSPYHPEVLAYCDALFIRADR